MKKRYIETGALLAFLAVALGAFGAHVLKGRIEPHLLEVYKTGVQYHLAHALGLILVGIIMEVREEDRLYLWAGNSMLSGTILFSGSLYLLAMTGIGWLGAITPFGGVLFLAAWLLLAIAALRRT